MIFGTCTIYTITGYRIWQRTVELHSLSQDSYHFGTIESTIGAKGGDMVNGSAANKIVVTTQIQCDIQLIASPCGSPGPERRSIDSFSSVQMFSMGTQPDDQITEQPLDDLEAQNSLHSSKSECHGGEVTMITSTLPADDSEVPNLSTPRFVGKKRGRTHAAAMAYFQVAFLMFIALTIVWVPSSINRMYQFVNARHPSFALNIISAIVLPLQGAWNAAISSSPLEQNADVLGARRSPKPEASLCNLSCNKTCFTRQYQARRQHESPPSTLPWMKSSNEVPGYTTLGYPGNGLYIYVAPWRCNSGMFFVVLHFCHVVFFSSP